MPPHRFRISLRDILWLTLLLAALVAALHSHYRDSRQLKQLEDWYNRSRNQYAGDAQLAAGIRRKEIQLLTDEELSQTLREYLSAVDYYTDTYEFALSELVRRRCTTALERHHQHLANLKETDSRRFFWPHLMIPAEIALQRSQDRADPLRIGCRRDEDTVAPCLRVWCQNEAGDIEPSRGYRDPGDGHWRIEMIDETGQRVAWSNYKKQRGLWVSRSSRSLGNEYRLDLREFVAPPRSGVHRLRLLYREGGSLGMRNDVDGLIVVEAPPLTVRVHNPEDPPVVSLEAGIPLAIALLPPGLLAMGWLIALRKGLPTHFGRDLVWCSLILAIGLIWFVDQQALWMWIRDALPDEQAPWTMEVV
jgi:hypothetical protein